MKRIRLSTLKPHPVNAKIYADRDIADLVESISTHGLLEPLVVSPSRIILSGHRRFAALQTLGMKMALARTLRVEDDELALVEFNRSRIRTWSERYRELQIILPRLRSIAEERRSDGARHGAAKRHGLAVTKVGHRHGRCRVYEEVGRISGLGRESARKLLRVFEAIDEGIVPSKLGERLDVGEFSLNRAYTEVQRAVGKEKAAQKNDQKPESSLPFDPFDIWSFHKRAKKYDLPGENGAGSPPGQMWVQLIQLLTELGDAVLDPMAGTGTVARVCTDLGRQCHAFDIEPRGPEVLRHDLYKGPPPIDSKVKLAVLDPPYGSQMLYSKRKNDLSRCPSTEVYLERLSKCLSSLWSCVGAGGSMAIVVGSDSNQDYDLSWEVGKLVQQYSKSFQRIWVPYAPQQHAGHRVSRARTDKRLLSLKREIFIVRAQ